MADKKDIQKRALGFGILVTQYYLKLKEKKYYEVASQLFRSGTSVGANIAEAQGAFTDKDFVHKLSLALKECLETEYWIDLLEQGFGEDVNVIKSECKQLVKILTTIVKKLKDKE